MITTQETLAGPLSLSNAATGIVATIAALVLVRRQSRRPA